MNPSRERGHRLVPHTADIIIEAWAPNRIGCLEEVCVGLVRSFAEQTEGNSDSEGNISVRVEDVADLLEEVLFRMDAEGVLPAEVVCDPGVGGSAVCHLRLLPLDAFAIVGAVPKAVSRSGLVFEERPGGWHCRVLIDV